MTDEENIARQIKDQANESIRALLKIFDITGLSESSFYDEIQESLCVVLSELDASLLMALYKKFPSLDDLGD